MDDSVVAIRNLAQLSRLALTSEEVELFSRQTQEIVAYFRTLQRLDLTGIEPTSHVIDIECPRRADECGPVLTDIAAIFPYVKYGYFQVPSVISRDDRELKPPSPSEE